MPFFIIKGDPVKYAEKIKADVLVVPSRNRDRQYMSYRFDPPFYSLRKPLAAAREPLGYIRECRVAASGYRIADVSVVFVSAKYPMDHDELKMQMYLRKCYHHILSWAEKAEIKSIVIPLLGFGAYDELNEKTAVEAVGVHIRMTRTDLNIYLVLPPDIRPVYIEDPAELPGTPKTAEYDDIYAQYDRKFEEELRLSGIGRAEFCKNRLYKYLNSRIENAEQLSREIDYDKGSICKFRSGKIAKPRKHRVIAMAIGMGLSDEERYDLIKCAGYRYPEDERDRIVESLMRSGCRDFKAINEKLCDISPEFALNAASRENAPRERSAKDI